MYGCKNIEKLDYLEVESIVNSKEISIIIPAKTMFLVLVWAIRTKNVNLMSQLEGVVKGDRECFKSAVGEETDHRVRKHRPDAHILALSAHFLTFMG